MQKKPKVILLVVITVLIIFIGAIYFDQKPSINYTEVELLTTRLDTVYKILHEIIQPNERLGEHIGAVESDLYQKNEGWMIRNKTLYCSNRLIDDIDIISSDTGINT